MKLTPATIPKIDIFCTQKLQDTGPNLRSQLSLSSEPTISDRSLARVADKGGGRASFVCRVPFKEGNPLPVLLHPVKAWCRTQDVEDEAGNNQRCMRWL